ALGAIPESGPRPAIAPAEKLPAAIPATWVPCSDSSGSNGRFAYFQVVVGGAKARATITFGVVKAVSPFGNPAGIVYPAGLKNGCAWSTPSSMIPIFTPLPAVSNAGSSHIRLAPISCGLRSRSGRYVSAGQTL